MAEHSEQQADRGRQWWRPAGRREARTLAAVVALSVGTCVDAFTVAPAARLPISRRGVFDFRRGSACRAVRAPVARQSEKGVKGITAYVSVDVTTCKVPEVVKGGVQTHYPRTQRIVALGDVHGDSYALSTVLFNAGLIDQDAAWAGGEAVLVQVGDVLDRGPDEAFCLSTLMRLQKEAREAGGDVIMILGNHEVMNSDLDYRYVDPLGWLGWDDESDQQLAEQMRESMQGKGGGRKKDKGENVAPSNWKMLLQKATELSVKVGRPAVKVLPPFMQGRIKALGGREGALATQPVVVTVGSTVFCHAGVMPEVVAYGLQRLNSETSAYLRGEVPKKPAILDQIPQISPIWHREFGKESLENDINALKAADTAMSLLGCKRMVIGHTPQQGGINCVRTPEGREIWRVDTGMSQGIAQGALETLEIADDGLPEERVSVLAGAKIVKGVDRTAEAAPRKQLTLEEELAMLRLAGEPRTTDAMHGKHTKDSLLTPMTRSVPGVQGPIGHCDSGQKLGRAKFAQYMEANEHVKKSREWRPRVEV